MRQDLAVRLRMVYSGERQQAAVAGAPEADEAGQAAEKVAQEIPVLALAPAQPPPQPPPAPQPHTMSQRIERVEEEEQYDDLAETMIWYMLKKTCVELIRAF
ncbi:hypothetical protein Tco_0480448 [Tanacetum coccineum]